MELCGSSWQPVLPACGSNWLFVLQIIAAGVFGSDEKIYSVVIKDSFSI